MGEAAPGAPPLHIKGRGAGSGPALPRGGAAIFGTAPGARLNTIKVDFQSNLSKSPTVLVFQTSFILGEPAGRRDTSGGPRSLAGPRRDQARDTRQAGLPLPATMLCCGGKKVKSHNFAPRKQ